MMEDTDKKIAEILQNLDEASPAAIEWARETGTWMMGVWMKQAIVCGLVWGIIAVAAIIAAIASWRYLRRFYAKRNSHYDVPAETIILLIVSLVAVPLGAGLSLWYLLNPQYHAIEKWLDLIGR